MYKYIFMLFFSSLLCRRIYFPLCIWVKEREIRDRFIFFGGERFLACLPADIEKDGRLFLKLEFCVFREQYTPRLWFLWKLHVLPFSCFSFWFRLPRNVRNVHLKISFKEKSETKFLSELFRGALLIWPWRATSSLSK